MTPVKSLGDSRFKNVFLLLAMLTVVYFIFVSYNTREKWHKRSHLATSSSMPSKIQRDYNVWLIFTKVTEKSPLRYKFRNLIENILNISSVPLQFHIIVDDHSENLARREIFDVVSHANKIIEYTFYDVEVCAALIDPIVQIMTPHFSSKPGTYYSDALFYLSLGLDLIAPRSQRKAVLLDCDLYFKKDIKLLFDEFNRFKSTALFGLAPELTPVYRHVLQLYKAKHNTTFGEYYHRQNISGNMPHPKGFQGYNSGVILINLSAIRKSKEYFDVMKNETVISLATKYRFRGHLGDQDFYTLIGYEYPHLIQTLNCGFNRQLCVWWRNHGYRDVFDLYFQCKHPIVILHGNCNTRIPK